MAGVFLPWQMPINMMAREAWRGDLTLLLRMAGGAIVGLALITHLSRRELQ